MATSIEKETKSKVFDPRAWGLSHAEIKKLGQRLYEFCERYAECFQTATRDTSHYAQDFSSGLLRMGTPYLLLWWLANAFTGLWRELFTRACFLV